MDIVLRLQEGTRFIDNCWRYTLGSRVGEGYASILYEGKQVRVNRLSAHIFHGLDLNNPKKQALHVPACKFKDCWNPEHLYVGDHLDNMTDRRNAHKTCSKGHELNDKTSFKDSRGSRRCIVCRREQERIRYRKANPR
jgi:hypothetical protein